MKNPFVKENNTALIAVVAFSTLAAGALAYLFLTDSGNDQRKKIRKIAKAALKDKAVKVVSKKTKLPKKAVRAVADHVIK